MIKIILPASRMGWSGWVACVGFWVMGCSTAAVAQQVPPVNDIRQVLAAVDSFSAKMPTEQVYLHFDKPYYAAGDALWFKAYLVDASRAYSVLSSILYVELFNDSNTVVKRLALPVILGTARGDIPLDENDLPQGIYGIRAYTNWMRNFGESLFYYKYFYIGHAAAGSLLVDERHTVSGEGSGSMARLTLRLTDLGKQPIRNREFQVSVHEKKKSLYKERMTTSAQGLLQIDCELPAKSGARYVVVTLEDKGGGTGARAGGDRSGAAAGTDRAGAVTGGGSGAAAGENSGRTVIPIYLNRPENASLQFMPEGGVLVAGLPAHVAWRAAGEDGKGEEVKGTVTDSHNKKIADLVALHGGMGSFDFIPVAGETYTARVRFMGEAGGTGGNATGGAGPKLVGEKSAGAARTYPLPVVAESGATLQQDGSSSPDTLVLAVGFSPDRVDGAHKYLLIGQERGAVVYGATVTANRSIYSIRIPRLALPTGIVRFSLLGAADLQPLNERLVYIDRQDLLQIAVTTDAAHYGLRDSIAVHLQVKDAAGKPVAGSFSLAVTDETQVKGDSLQDDDILTRMFLSADLKGPIEDPAFYFHDRDPLTLRALDNLLLTREGSWVDWKQVLGNPPAPAFLAQKEFTVRGKATNLLNKGIKQTHVALLSGGQGRPEIVKDTVTDDQGVFVFDHFPPFDSATFFIQARNRRGKDFGVGIEVEDLPPPPLDASPAFPVQPWFVNGDDDLLQYMTVNAAWRREQESLGYPGKGTVLPVFTVRGKKMIPDSHNLNGPGNADQIVDEDQLKKDGKVNLLQVLEKEVKGFHEGAVRRSTTLIYMLNEKRIRFSFDGVNLGFVMPGADHLTIRDYLESYSAEDIKGIEVMYNPGYAAQYDFQFSTTGRLRTLNSNNAWLEITTRSGKGPYQRHTPGTWLYTPQPFYFGRTFYRPRYPAGSTGGGVAGAAGAVGGVGDGITGMAGATVSNAAAGGKGADYKDLRSTIHWASDIITDSTGHATISFFAADRPGSYRIVVEGSDMNGLMGTGGAKVAVGKP